MGTGKSTLGSALAGEPGAFESKRSARAVTGECRFVMSNTVLGERLGPQAMPPPGPPGGVMGGLAVPIPAGVVTNSGAAAAAAADGTGSGGAGPAHRGGHSRLRRPFALDGEHPWGGERWPLCEQRQGFCIAQAALCGPHAPRGVR